MERITDPHGRLMRCLRACVAPVACVILWLSYWSVPVPRSINLDVSWQLVLAHAAKNRWCAGRDYVFTHGPTGYFFLKHPSYDPELFYAALAVSAVWALLVAVLIWSALRRLVWSAAIAGFLLATLVLGEVPPVADASVLAVILVCTTICLESEGSSGSPRYWQIAGASLLFSVLALAKVTYLAASVFGWAGICWSAGRRRGAAPVLFCAASFPAALLFSWVIVGQRILDLPLFVRGWFELLRGYGEAMALPAPVLPAVLAAAALTAWTVSVGLRPPRVVGLSRGPAVGLALVWGWIAWKAGFTRYDPAHASVTCAFAAVAPFLWGGAFSRRATRPARMLGVLGVAAACTALYAAGAAQGYAPWTTARSWVSRAAFRFQVLLSPQQTKKEFDAAWRQLAAQEALPKIQRRVGGAGIDVFPPAQGVLLLQGLNYRPRPVFQGHLACTAYLLRLNAAFYEDPDRAPRFVLFALLPVDERFPSHEDSQALLALAWYYKPVLAERGFVLLERRAPVAPHPRARGPHRQWQSPPGRWLALTGLPEPGLAALRISRSWPDRFWEWLVQPQRWWLELEDHGGRTLRYRIVPAMAQVPFLLNPILAGPGDMQRWLLGRHLESPRRMRLVPEGELWGSASVVLRLEPGMVGLPLGIPGAHDTMSRRQRRRFPRIAGDAP